MSRQPIGLVPVRIARLCEGAIGVDYEFVVPRRRFSPRNLEELRGTVTDITSNIPVVNEQMRWGKLYGCPRDWVQGDATNALVPWPVSALAFFRAVTHEAIAERTIRTKQREALLEFMFRLATGCAT